VFFKDQTYISYRKLLIIKLLSTYDITVVTEIIIPLIVKYNINPTTLYSNLVTNLKNSISSGNFALFLQSESVLLNSSTMLNVIVSNYTISQMTVLNQTNIPTAIPTNIPTAIPDSKITDNLSQKKILIIILVSIGVFIGILSVFLYVLYKVNRSSNINFNIRSINNNINSINTENIVISINHNE
jgi:hypothetical protein